MQIKYTFLILVMIGLSFPSLANADGMADLFIDQCAAQEKYSQSYCACSLNAFSENLREQKKKQLKQVEVYYKGETEEMLKDPEITQGKLDAVCDLHDLAKENELMASQARMVNDRDGYKAYTQKKLDLFEEKRALAESYNADHKILGALVSGNYCDNRAQVNQITSDQADKAEPYAEVRRLIELNHPYLQGQVIRVGNQKQCKQ